MVNKSLARRNFGRQDSEFRDNVRQGKFITLVKTGSIVTVGIATLYLYNCATFWLTVQKIGR